MVMEIACQCQEGLGLPHTHIGKRFIYRTPDDREVTLDELTAKLNSEVVKSWNLLRVEEATIRTWINWKAVTKAIMEEVYERGTCPTLGCQAHGEALTQVWTDGRVLFEFCDCCSYRRRITES